MPLSPLWANLPKRHCDDCGKLFKPVKPSRPGECYFCSANCRKSYHKHGGAYRKLKAEMQKMIRRELPMLVSAGVAAELNRRGSGVPEIETTCTSRKHSTRRRSYLGIQG